MKELLKNEALFLMLEKVMGKKIGKDGIYKIQQAGQKYAGICYMDVADEFFYQCLSNTTSTVNDGALFKKIGVSENEDKLSNLSDSGNLITLPNGDGILFVNKSSGASNIIDCSGVFSKIYQCVVSPWLSGDNTVVTVPIYQKTTGGVIYINALIFTKSTGGWVHKISGSVVNEETYASARCIVFGKLI